MDSLRRMVKIGRVLVGLILGLALYLGGGMAFASPDAPQRDVSKIMGPDECGECHKSEVQAWKGSHHFKTFKALLRDKKKKEKAKKIAGKMGIKRIKKDPACLGCHFTEGFNKKGKRKAIAGISCESCHSPSKEWIEIHGDFGGKKVKREDETPEHKVQRMAKMKSSGMIRPATLYRLAKNCFQCHTVPNEELVNKGEHTPGSKFELVSWSQGEIRHNFIQSKGKTNEPASTDRKRVLYLVGQVLDLEFSLRSLAMSKEEGKFADAMAKRIMAARGKVKEIQGLVPLSELTEILAATEALDLKPNNQSNLKKAASTIATVAEKLADNQDGTKLAALDQLIPDKYKGKPGEGKPSS